MRDSFSRLLTRKRNTRKKKENKTQKQETRNIKHDVQKELVPLSPTLSTDELLARSSFGILHQSQAVQRPFIPSSGKPSRLIIFLHFFFYCRCKLLTEFVCARQITWRSVVCYFDDMCHRNEIAWMAKGGGVGE